MDYSINDLSYPIYLTLSHNLGYVLVSQLFDGTNFGYWKRAMIIALSLKKKIGFVDGFCVKPDLNSLEFSSLDSL